MKWDTGWVAAGLSLALLGGCTFGLGETESFATRDLELSGQLSDGTFSSDETVIALVTTEADLARGVTIFLDGQDADHTVASQLRFEGNLGALCPGAQVELRGADGVLGAVSATGAPTEMLADLESLQLLAATTTSSTETGAVEELRPSTVTVTARPSTDGFTRMEVWTTTLVDGEERTIGAAFDVARVVEDTDVPGWSGDMWDGEPIAQWE